ncbi:MAG: nucleotidyltransferase family protein [Planctomycetota bacterium]|jgi:hypothetical protein
MNTDCGQREASLSTSLAAEPSADPTPRPPGRLRGHLSAAALRNVRMMHLLERIASRFNEASVPLMALKGAALNLSLYEQPDERPMTDLDLLVPPTDIGAAEAAMEAASCLRSDIVFREDFFPRYYYEIEYTAGAVDPVLIDLHVRPFRVLRYSRFVPAEAMWEGAEPVRMGSATVLVPSADDMLIHLAGHSAIHANCRKLWLQDISGWVEARRDTIDWDRFLARVRAWRLALAVRSALDAAECEQGEFLPALVRRQLAGMQTTWRDRLALWHAPRDGDHLTRSFIVNLLTTPGSRFKLGYVRDVLAPDRKYMDKWQSRNDCQSPGWAHARRCLNPIVRRLPRFERVTKRIDVRESAVHGLGVFAKRDFRKGDVITRYRGRPIDRSGAYVAWHTDASGRKARHEITGPLKFLNHSCRPRAELVNFRLVALKPIVAGREITIDYGDDACTCKRDKQGGDDAR